MIKTQLNKQCPNGVEPVGRIVIFNYIINCVMKKNVSRPAMKYFITGSIVALLTAMSAITNAGLIHRYSFDSNANDSVGSSHGSLEGNAYVQDGSVVLDGTSGTFVNLPGGLLNGLESVTFEAWATFGSSGNWCRLFDFGDTSAAGNGRYYLFLSPHSGAQDVRFVSSDADPGYNHEQIISSPGVLDGQGPIHIVAVYNPPKQFMGLYIDGKLVASRNDVTIPMSSIQNVYSYLGKSLYNPDAYWNGSIDEFRIYDSALTAAQIAANFAAGPSVIDASPGAVEKLIVSVAATMDEGGSQKASVSADFKNVKGINIIGDPELSIVSTDQSILSVDNSGLILARKAGTASIIVSYQTISVTNSIKVNEKAPVLIHRYSFDQDAKDSVGTADGNLVGATIQDGEVVFDGAGAYVDFPNGILTNLSSITIELWATDFGSSGWARLLDFGNSQQGEDNSGTGTQYLFISLPSGAGNLRVAITDGSGEQQLNAPRPPANQKTHIAFVYKASEKTGWLFVDGQIVAVNTNMTITPANLGNTVNNWLGRSQWNDPYFWGSIDEFRIYDGALDPLIIAAHTAGGPNNIIDQLGNVVSLSITAADTMVSGGVQTVSVMGTFENVTNIPVTAASGLVLSSSDTKILSVDQNGKLLALKAGTAQVQATFMGKTVSKTIVVTERPPVLTHRYSFTQDASDTVGGADGTLFGNAYIQNGSVILDGTSGTYVDLPNGLLTNYTSITIETWVTDAGSANWSRIFDFGNSIGGEDINNGASQTMFLTLPSGSGNLRFAINKGTGEQQVNATRPPVNQKVFIALVIKASERSAMLFVDGKLVGINTNVDLTPMDLGYTVNNWLGRSQYNDPYFNGQIDEFRIYDGALEPMLIAAHASAGPDKIVDNVGALKSVTVGTQNQIVKGSINTIIGLFENIQNVPVTTAQGAEIISADNDIVGVLPSGELEGRSTGKTSVTVNYGGKQVSIEVTVVAASGVPEKPVLLHRYSFDEPAGSTNVIDSVGGANGLVVGTNGIFSGDGKLTITNGTYVDLPNNLISVLTNVTFEMWVTWNGPANSSWQRIFDFGTNSAGEGAQGTGLAYLFVTPRSGSSTFRFCAKPDATLGEQNVDCGAPLEVGKEYHIVAVYDYVAGVSRVYLNGVRVGTGLASIPLSSLSDINNWLGRSNWPDPAFNGVFNEFRIWSGAMTDPEVTQNYQAGANSLEAKTTLSVTRSAGNIVISWPATATGYTLEKSTTLGNGANWSAVTIEPVVEDGRFKVSIPFSEPISFFRLRK